MRKAFDDLLPSKLSGKPTIDVKKLTDNLAFTNSVIDQNPDKFKPWEDRVYGLLKGKSEREIEKWHREEETLLEHILGAIALTSGLLARGFQMADFQYNSLPMAKRNLFIFRGTVVIGWPKSKSFSKMVQDSLWALPPDLGEHLLLYLGVIRPVSIKLTIQRNRSPNRFAGTHIFVSAPGKNGGNARQAWNGPRIDNVLRSKTESMLGLRLSSGMLRQLITAIFREHLADLIDDPTKKTTSIANLQADHSQNTGNMQYGKTTASGIALRQSDEDMMRFVKVSQSWQALLGVVPPGQEMQMRLLKTPHMALRAANYKIAMIVARAAIRKEYDIGGANSAKTAKSLLNEQPFLPRVEDESLGDTVLIQTVSALIYGLGSPSVGDSAPVLGVSEEIITDAVVLITLGLWEVGNCVQYDLDRSIDARDELTELILPQMTQVLEEDKKAMEGKKWQALGIEVYKRAKATHTGQIGSSELTAYYKKNATV
ncbi:hypothetical protein BDZ97DRAFT_1844762 [Flammula alnicola]|nr:hypothetical protein BDZ97DRAFT_1844762 [Flammula alnicola]